MSLRSHWTRHQTSFRIFYLVDQLTKMLYSNSKHFFPAIRISWQTFNILSQDETLLDLFTYIGDPFPRQTSSTASLSAKHTSTYSLEAPPPPSSNAVSATCTSEVDVSELEEEFDEDCDGDGLSLFRVSLKAHEGVASSEPFDVHPKQMVSFVFVAVFLFVCFVCSGEFVHSDTIVNSVQFCVYI